MRGAAKRDSKSRDGGDDDDNNDDDDDLLPGLGLYL